MESNIEFQKEKLYQLLKFAVGNIPFYIDFAKKENLVISKENILNVVKKFPIMTKADIQNEFNRLSNLSNKSDWFYNYSGGSTGEPTKVIQDKRYWANTTMVTKLHYEWADFTFGDNMVVLWGSQKSILKEKEKLKKRFSNWIKSIYHLNSFSMDNSVMENYIKFINKKKPKLILSYAQSINELSKYILQNNIKVHSPNSIMSSAGILYPEFRKNIEEAFNCPVFNRYGSREIGSIACECEKHEGLHISTFTHYVEILNDNLIPCKEGEMGNIYVTLLENYRMPLIRYKIGDQAIYTEKKCSCGRGLPIIEKLVGRDTDVFKTRDGKIIDGNFFVHFTGVVYNNGGLEKFQIVQKDYDLIQINAIIKNHNLFEEAKDRIEESYRKVLGDNCKIIWNKVSEIKPLSSGKYRYTIREFN
ncbi:MAG TPA: hypothetical protein VLN45_11755 [Ignavibacteriaceae bacterium]|nr:hypothetical protein [Ignavibacteriaceae bacterium]